VALFAEGSHAADDLPYKVRSTAVISGMVLGPAMLVCFLLRLPAELLLLLLRLPAELLLVLVAAAQVCGRRGAGVGFAEKLKHGESHA